jgi:mannan endo-1,4-beta-mannosidase
VKEKVPASASASKAPATKPATAVTTAKIASCSDFTWQQDAQAAYVANLSDPGALDGAKGPNNGDGIACNQLPSDPNRAKSIPVDAYVPPAPTAADKSALIAPSTKYFGVAEDGLPGDTSMLDTIDKEVGKAPNLVEYFQNLDTGFRGDQVQEAWARGALPVITMQTQGSQSGTDYSLKSIVDGGWDSYFLTYAGNIRATNLPLVLRFDHEMNGNWYSWSGGLPENQGAAGQPNLYVQAWQHVWNLFQQVGANADVIWAWTPERVDGLSTSDTGHTCKTTVCQYETPIAADYPGNQYVDWVGFSGYAWKPPTTNWTAASTYDATVASLEKLTSKPIFIAETAAEKAYGGTPATSTTPATPGQDTSAAQAQWISQAVPYIADNPRIVAFAYFNNDSTGAHIVDGGAVDTDWRLDDSPGALAAFKAGITNPVFGSGIMPDSSGG